MASNENPVLVTFSLDYVKAHIRAYIALSPSKGLTGEEIKDKLRQLYPLSDETSACVDNLLNEGLKNKTFVKKNNKYRILTNVGHVPGEKLSLRCGGRRVEKKIHSKLDRKRKHHQTKLRAKSGKSSRRCVHKSRGKRARSTSCASKRSKHYAKRKRYNC